MRGPLVSKISDSEPTWDELVRGLAVPTIFGFIFLLLIVMITCVCVEGWKMINSPVRKRLVDMTGHFEDLGDRLQKATESYNKAIGSLETRVLVSARRFAELQAAPPDQLLQTLEPVEQAPRKIERA